MTSFEFEKELQQDLTMSDNNSIQKYHSDKEIKTDKAIQITQYPQSSENLSKQLYQPIKKSRFGEQLQILQPSTQKITLKDLENMGVRCRGNNNQALKQKLQQKKYQFEKQQIECSMEFMDFDEIYEVTTSSCSKFNISEK